MLIKTLNLLANPFSIQNMYLMGKLFSPSTPKKKKELTVILATNIKIV